MSDLHTIPRGLDRPVPILLWEPTEFVVAILLLGVGVILKMLVIGVGGAAGVMYYSSKVKRRGKRGMGMHLLWRLGFVADKGLKKYAPAPSKVDFTR